MIKWRSIIQHNEISHLIINVKPRNIPMDPSLKLVSNQGKLYFGPGRFKRLVGTLNHFIMSRHDSTFAISVGSQLLSSRAQYH